MSRILESVAYDIVLVKTGLQAASSTWVKVHILHQRSLAVYKKRYGSVLSLPRVADGVTSLE